MDPGGVAGTARRLAFGMELTMIPVIVRNDPGSQRPHERPWLAGPVTPIAEIGQRTGNGDRPSVLPHTRYPDETVTPDDSDECVVAGDTEHSFVTIQGQVVGSRVRTADAVLLGIAGGRMAATITNSGSAIVDVEVADNTGTVTLVFFGWSLIRGLEAGITVRAAGRVLGLTRHPRMINPRIELLPAADVAGSHRTARPVVRG